MTRTALVIIDMQQAMADRIADGRDCANPEAGTRIAALAADFRARGLPVLHVRHHDPDPASSFHAGKPGAAPLPCDTAAEGEPVFCKSTSSAFASTDLAAYLKREGIGRLVITGAVAGFCVTSTVRAASDLGFAVVLPRDALLGFDLPFEGARLPAQTILQVTLATLGADFATLTTTEALRAGL
ncbi:MAG: cysteine hydrolase family protein, partial [Pseudorhodobacter sp.]|nr:cysteine hydrolase family protein [Pseudorhodobacter sp.]